MASAVEESGHETQIYTYFGSLTLLVYLAVPHGYLVDIATSFMLKNQLHMSADAVSMFRLITGIPVYFAFLFGLLRDRWSPFGLRDRGHFLVFAPITGAIFVWLAYGKLELLTLGAGIFATMMTFRMVAAGYQGLISLVGQEKLMPGRLSVVWNVAMSIPYVIAAWSSGWVTEHLKPHEIFLLMAALCLAMGVFGVWKPKAVFADAYAAPLAKHSTFFQDVKRLVRHRAIYAAVGIYFLWSFAPGSSTPLQFYLTDRLHLNDSAFANYTAIFVISFIPTYLLYGYLCKRIAASKLLFWGTIVAIPQMIPLLFIHTSLSAELMAIPIGLMGGVATAAYIDLAIRSCPAGLQGTLMMLVDGGYVLAFRGGDLLGTKIYLSSKTDGFLYCVIATTTVYALILPLLLLVPRRLVATRDGEENSEIDADAMAVAAAS